MLWRYSSCNILFIYLLIISLIFFSWYFIYI